MKVYIIEGMTEVFDTFEGALTYLISVRDIISYQLEVFFEATDSMNDIQKLMAGEGITRWVFREERGDLYVIIEKELRKRPAPLVEDGLRKSDMRLRFVTEDRLETLDGTLHLYTNKDGTDLWSVYSNEKYLTEGTLSDLQKRFQLIIECDIADDMDTDTFRVTT